MAHSFSVSTTFLDKAGALWLGTWPILYKHDPNQRQFKFVAIDPPPTKWAMQISSLYQDKENVLWIGTFGRGILKYDPGNGQISNFAPDSTGKRHLSSRWVRSIIEDHSGTIWIATLRGLNRYHQQQDRFEQFYWDPDKPDNPKNLISNYLYCLYEDSKGNLWIGSARGLSRLDNIRRQFSHFLNRTDQINLIGHYFGAIHENQTGSLLIGGKGLFQFDPATGELSRYFHNPSDSSSCINAIVFDIQADRQGDVWVATLDGLYRLRNNQPMLHYTEKNGLPDRYVTAIFEDKQNILWIVSREHLTRYNPQSRQFKQFKFKEGLGEKSCFQGKDGRLYFGEYNGFLTFNPAAIQDNRHIPPVWITNFKVFDQALQFERPLSDLKEINLSYRQNFFTLDFVALNYTDSKKNQYAYMLEGIDTKWVAAGDRRSASYTNVPPGKYLFKVKGSNNDWIWNEKGAMLRIVTTPPWWQTTWAYVFYALILVSMLVGLWRFQVRRIKERNELKMKSFETQKLHEIDSLKSRFFANISHEFRTPLTLILGPLNKMLSQTTHREKKQELKLMQRNARRLQRLINQLLDLSKIEAGKMTLQTRPEDIVALLNRIVQSFESQAKLKGIDLKFQSEQNEIIAYIDRDKIENIFYNLLSNALKFTPEGGEVSVQLSVISKQLPHTLPTDHWLLITVEDTDIGIPPDRLDKIFDRFYQVDDSYTREHEGSGIGLALTKELVELHHGKIEVQSELNKSTTFTVYLPLGKGHLKLEEISGKPSESSPLSEGLPIEERSESSELSERLSPPSCRKALPLVLIVEDNRDMRSYLKDCLASDYRVIEAVDGEDGLHRAIDKIPDLIISDVMMPQMDGFQLCQRLKTDEKTSHIPIILLTARAAAADKIGGLEFGADDYIIKPFDTKELLVRVKNLIQQRRLLRKKFSQQTAFVPDEIATTPVDVSFLTRAKHIVEKHIADEQFSVESLSKSIGMSRSQLHRKLRALTDRSASEFIRTLRLQRAAYLLQQKQFTVTEVAFEVGFNNPSYFAACFRKQFGRLPSEYTNKI